jgi:dihydrofolate reductase
VSKVKCQISISADGFLAGPNQSEEHPLGEGGMALHDWVVKLAAWREAHGREGGEVTASSEIFEAATTGTGAVIMGRNMFGPVRGPWTEPLWNGWWGEEPPFHVPVFVLTHHEREPLTLGETTFHFVTDGPGRAVELAREAAGEKDVSVGGGGETIQELIRLFDGIPPSVQLEQTRVVEGPEAAHLLYAVG